MMALYSSYDRISIQNHKIVCGMMFFSQINILDIRTGELKGYRLKNTPGFDDMPEGPLVSYNHICADDKMIIGLYINQDFDIQLEHGNISDIIHIYDWDGNFLHIVKLDNKVIQVAFDPVGKCLYGYTPDEKIFRYDFKMFY